LPYHSSLIIIYIKATMLVFDVIALSLESAFAITFTVMIVNIQGWDDQKYKFKMKSFFEVSTSRLDGTRCTYIILGFPTDKPTVIWKKDESQDLKKHPTAISSRAYTKFVREELVKILKRSNMFLEVLEGHVLQSYVEANGMATAQQSKSNQPTISSADDESAAAEEEKRRQQLQEQEMAEEREEEKAEEAPTTTATPLTFDPKAGEVADPKQNPLMDLFKIPSNNMQTLTQLHKELTRTIQKQTVINGQDVGRLSTKMGATRSYSLRSRKANPRRLSSSFEILSFKF
jgi:hypothetical protein